MPRWDPKPIWLGEDAYIVGGGPSLRTFDWDLIRGKNTIGCNSAFSLGADIVKINIFGDLRWWEEIGSKQASSYGGIMIGCLSGTEDAKCEWLLTMKRSTQTGLSKKELGFNGNSGSLAVNLALILGARRVFLLGFDMKLGTRGQANWHDIRYEKAQAEVYQRFINGFAWVKRDLPKHFPGCEIINLTDDSKLDLFPKVSLAEHFKREKTQ